MLQQLSRACTARNLKSCFHYSQVSRKHTCVMSENSNTDGRVADAVREHWADRLLPQSWRPFARLARLERPIGWWLLLLPGWWAIALSQVAAGGGLPNVWFLVLFPGRCHCHARGRLHLQRHRRPRL
jgi:hypothetical protein